MCGIEIDSVVVCGSTLTCFCAAVKIGFAVVCAENRLVLMNRSKMTWFLCVDPNDLFLFWGSIESVFVWVFQIDLVLCSEPEFTRFSVSIEIDLVYFWVGEINLV